MGRRRSASPRWKAERRHRSNAHGCLGQLYLAQGDLEHAIRVLDQGLALCRASGDRNWLRPIAADLGSAYALQGRLAEGRVLVEEAIRESIRTGALGYRSRWVAQLSEVCRLAGRGEEAWQHACQALDLARQQKERGHEALALHQLGAVHAHADPPDVAQAEVHYQQALTLAEELGMRPLVAHCHLGLGTAVCQTGQRRAGPRRPDHRHRPVPRHGHDLLAAPGRSRAGAGKVGRTCAGMAYDRVQSSSTRPGMR